MHAKKKNLTQIYVSKKTGINNKTISNYENNISSPDPETLKIFARVYETSADYLIGVSEADSEKETDTEYNDKYVSVSGLPDDAVKQVEEYVEFLKQKYKK